ncbi:MAG: hypothetical protein LH645_07370 [Actinomycetia bacterium]|nr:hypothetical protein [Actinomycetes bacterium]
MKGRLGGHDLRPVSVALFLIGVLSLTVEWAVGISAGLVIPLEPAVGTAALLPAMLVGLVISLRRPQLVIGPLVVALGASPAVTFGLEAWAANLEVDPRPGAQVAAWIAAGSWIWFYVWPALIAVYFPDGRLPGPRWWPVAGGLMVLPAVMQVGFTLDPTTYGEDSIPGGPPAALEIDHLPAVVGVLLLSFLGLLIAAVTSLVRRYRRGDTVTRLQIRWLAAGAAAFPITLVTGWIVSLPTGGWSSFFLLGLALGALTMPVSIAIAVLRHGLWDLGRLVSRTTAYLAVTLSLAATYALVVSAMSWVLPGESSVVVAVATLIVAAAFRPLLRRVQQQVDRRFNREQFDGHRSVEEFGARLRDQVHPDDVVVDLVDVLTRTLQPTTVRVWRSP